MELTHALLEGIAGGQIEVRHPGDGGPVVTRSEIKRTILERSCSDPFLVVEVNWSAEQTDQTPAAPRWLKIPTQCLKFTLSVYYVCMLGDRIFLRYDRPPYDQQVVIYPPGDSAIIDRACVEGL